MIGQSNGRHVQKKYVRNRWKNYNYWEKTYARAFEENRLAKEFDSTGTGAGFKIITKFVVVCERDFTN